MEFNATFLTSAISFIVFTTIMNAIFYKPLAKIVDERQKFILDTNEEAKQTTKKAESILKDKEKKLEKTKHEAKKIIVDKSEEVKTQKTELAETAQKKAVQEIEGAKNILNQSKDDAQKVLDNEVQKLAQEISSKILGG